MEYGLQVSGTYERVLEAARWAEANGFAAFALPDHYLMAMDEEKAGEIPAPDALIQLAGLARDTERIELVVLVSPITFRHPAVLAKSAIEISRMSGGRFMLGVGTGWMDREHEVFGFDYPEPKERFERLEDALGYLAAVFAEEPTGHDGRFYQLEKFPIQPRPPAPVPMVIGGMGPHKTPRLAGTYAREFNVYPAAPDEFRARIERARAAAVTAGRDPDAMRLSSSGQVVAGETEAEYLDKLAAVAADAGRTVEEIQEHYDKRNTPRGTYGQVSELLGEMADAGVSRFYLQRLGTETLDETAALLDAIRI